MKVVLLIVAELGLPASLQTSVSQPLRQSVEHNNLYTQSSLTGQIEGANLHAVEEDPLTRPYVDHNYADHNYV